VDTAGALARRREIEVCSLRILSENVEMTLRLGSWVLLIVPILAFEKLLHFQFLEPADLYKITLGIVFSSMAAIEIQLLVIRRHMTSEVGNISSGLELIFARYHNFDKVRIFAYTGDQVAGSVSNSCKSHGATIEVCHLLLYDCPKLERRPDFRSARAYAGRDRHRERRGEPQNAQAPQARHVRQVPLPGELLRALDRAFKLRRRQADPDLAVRWLWRWSRTTAWRRVKEIMAAAGITGPPAMPNGLRHGFGVNAFQSSVPPHLVQRWLGHASLRTTAIYGDVIGPEERAFAARMWVKRIK
jgi:integrase